MIRETIEREAMLAKSPEATWKQVAERVAGDAHHHVRCLPTEETAVRVRPLARAVWRWPACLGALGAVACGVVDGTTDERVTQGTFEDAYKDRYCEEWHTCGGAGMCPFEEPPEYNNFGPVLSADCEFDADAAEECLVGPWTCNSGVPGFETPIVPPVCEEVCV